ncbi:hypothetical protein [Candidatus Epulonipiscium viviparus]|uniref:hypothetical protein n=1 Tax=Candidatus Epulonipiscium viviparus TaxID=420336 RepID=UPI00016C08A5|nr:hypothetical protein [Candidatus Epulopiscium viviparus]
MKKFFAFTIASIISIGSFGSVMAAAPAAPAAPTVTVPLPTMSFETADGWAVGGPAAQFEVVTNAGVVDGTQALKVTATTRQTDWGILTKLHVNPAAGTIWSVPEGQVVAASVTNPSDQGLQIRWNISDNVGNTRMAFFLVPANSTREIMYTAETFGEPGVANGSWKTDGYGQKGVDETAIKAMSFYVAEPELEKVMPGVASPVYIIDNITLKPAPVAVPAQ